MDVISFQKIFGLGGLECHIVEIWRDVTLVHGRTTTEHEDRARILEAEFAIQKCEKVEPDNYLKCVIEVVR